MTLWVFPARMVADHIGVSNNVVLFWLTPWRRTDEHLPMSHIAEVTHTRGLIWDRISVGAQADLIHLRFRACPKGRPVTLSNRFRSGSTRLLLRRHSKLAVEGLSLQRASRRSYPASSGSLDCFAS